MLPNHVTALPACSAAELRGGVGAGSTGISLAMVAAAHGCRCAVALPDDAATEKGALLEALGARVLRQRPVSIAHPQHFVNVARRLAAEAGACRPANPRPGHPESPGPGCPEPCRAAAAGGIWRLAQTEANGTAALKQSGGGSASAGGGGSSGSGSERMAQHGQAAGLGAAAVSRDGGGAASAATSGSTYCAEGMGNAGGCDRSGDGGGGGAVFADQFENLANYRAHLATGAEIWAQVLRCRKHHR